MARTKKLKPTLAIHYSCPCCGITFLDKKLSYLRTGCDRCGSSLVAVKLREEESVKIAKINIGTPPAWKPHAGNPLEGWH